jgi:hypothetical protein
MTEETKVKVCPFMVDYIFKVNDCTTATVYKKCISTDCMAWCKNTVWSDAEQKMVETGYCVRLHPVTNLF